MARELDSRTYIRVHDGMPDHPKVEALSDAAFRLLVTTWCWCSKNLTDGRIPAKVWAKRGTPKARRELVEAGLIEIDGDAMAHDYLDHQRSRDEVAAFVQSKRDAALAGNHMRWHVRGKKPDPDCPMCVAGAIPPAITEASRMRSQSTSQTSRETSPEAVAVAVAVPGVGLGGEVPGVNARDELPPPRCPAHLDDPEPPPCGTCRDHRRRREQAERDQLRTAAERRSTEARQRAEVAAAEIATCPQCGPDGYRVGDNGRTVPCRHRRPA